MKIQKPIQEYVCTANHGRSVPAEVIAKDYLAKIGETECLEIISSGTGLEDFRKGNLKPGFMAKIMSKALSREIYAPAEKRFVEEILSYKTEALEDQYKTDPIFANALMAYFRKCEAVFEAEEHQYRQIAIEKRGLTHLMKQIQDQTVASEDVTVILPMAQSNLSAITQIYKDQIQKPQIMLLKEYTTGMPGDVMNAFGEPQKVYDSMIEELADIVPRAVDRTLEKYCFRR